MSLKGVRDQGGVGPLGSQGKGKPPLGMVASGKLTVSGLCDSEEAEWWDSWAMCLN